jgi:hypothetical protein
VHRLHAAVVGEWKRHHALLPPHMYLLHGIPLVRPALAGWMW